MFLSSLSSSSSVHRVSIPSSVQPTFYRRTPPPPSFRGKTALITVAAGDGIRLTISELQKKPTPLHLKHPSSSLLSSVSAPTTNHSGGRSLGFQPSPNLGLLSLLFLLSTAFGAIMSLAIVSIPALGAFRRLAASIDKLSKVVSDEVPGTLFSLKLSCLEINELIRQLGNIRQKMLGIQYGRKDRRKQPSGRGGKNPIVS